ncbi:MAG: DegT/DnrJ/EryC1/StrS family aminotransferase [Trueperaceae bacterium]|nr:MAG: DegT/DnrJ/EryC1/StrS family aminotransferase [Trueperaceae bacterium]
MNRATSDRLQRTTEVPAQVPWNNNALQYARIKDELAPEVERVLASGAYVLSEDVTGFEREFAAYCGVRHGVGVHSGTDAISILLRAIGLGPGDEVLVPVNSCSSEPNAIMLAGATPVPVDIDARTYNLDPEAVAAAIGPNTRLIHAVHAYGQPCAMGDIIKIARDHGVPVLEDISLAPGTTIDGERVGRFGDFAVASFGHGKILNAAGNGGGIIITDDATVAERARDLATYGSGFVSEAQPVAEAYLGPSGRAWLEPAFNSFLDAIQAATLRVKLRHLDRWLAERGERARWYDECLAELDVVTPHIAEGVTCAYRGYIIRVRDRNRVQAHLLEAGVETRAWYTPPVHLQPAMARYGYREGDFPAGEAFARELILLPLYPELETSQVEHVARTLRDALGGA